MAAHDPSKHRLPVGTAAGASIAHALNHVYDSVAAQVTLVRWRWDPVPLLLLGTMLILVYLGLRN